MIRVFIADDQSVVREGLKSMLNPEPDIDVVGEASNGEEALRNVGISCPDIVLMDVRMPGMDRLAALERLKAVHPRISVVMVTLYDDPDYLLRAVSAGAAGYLLKDATREDLLRAIRVIAEGGALIAPSMLPDLLHRLTRGVGIAEAASVRSTEVLTERELQVLRLVAQGLTNGQIAELLILSPMTVKTHVQNILQKLDVSDRTQAAVQAARRGLV